MSARLVPLTPLLLAVSLGGPGLALAASTSWVRAPYVQHVRPDAAVVAFELSRPCAATVHVLREGLPFARVDVAAAQARHGVQLRGLQPATPYSYRVEACELASQEATLRTAPAGPARVHFVAVGDSGAGNDAQAAVAAAIQARAPQLLLALGDNAYDRGSAREFTEKFFRPMAPLLREVPVFATLGNHEYGTQEGQPFLDAFHLPSNNQRATERYYSFDWGGVHFVSLDSSCVLGLAPASLCTTREQQDWLEADLARAQEAHWRVVFLHHPPWSSGRYGSFLDLRRAFSPTFEKWGVDLVLAGHEHDYERTLPMRGLQAVDAQAAGAVSYAVVGMGGASLRDFPGPQPAWSAVRSSAAHGFLEVVADAQTLSARALSADGQVLDAFSLPSRRARPTPTLALRAEPPEGPAPLTVRLHASASPSDSIAWSLPDGTQAQGEDVVHTFHTPGEVVVRALAAGPRGSVEASVTLRVLPPPAPAEPSPPVPPSPEASGPPSPGADASGCTAGAPVRSGHLAGLALGLAWLVMRRRMGPWRR